MESDQSLPITNAQVIGHANVIEALLHAVQEDRLHHTLLFSGPEGIGKRLIATKLAATFFCLENPSYESFGGCNHCHHCSLLSAGNMPDLFFVPCANKELASTEKVRELLRSLRLRPFSGKYRFLIFDDAHLLQGQAANALLKSLEEPREGTFFILVTGKPHLMLKTIHSRGQRWGFHRLADEELRQVLSGSTPDEGLITLANGSFESYRLLAERKERVLELQGSLRRIASGDQVHALVLGEALAKSKETLQDDLVCLGLIGRANLQEEKNLSWGNFLLELGEMYHHLFKRNFAAQYPLQRLLLTLAAPFQEKELFERDENLSNLFA